VTHYLENENEDMKKKTEVAESSELYRNINELALPATDRAQAIKALRIAEVMVGAVAYVIGLISALTRPSPKLKHQ
jgi:hypothetical protein